MFCAKLFQVDKSKAIPVTGRETLRLPHFPDNRLTDGSEFVSLIRQPLYNIGRFLVLIYVRG
jgi:hypothetical protein